MMRSVAIIERNTNIAARALNGIQNFLTFVIVDSHWFLGHYVAAKLHRPDNVRMMRTVHACHNNGIRLLLLDHPVEVL
ncbi:hypothetical protein D3C85_1837320 [compost metagenome]